MFSIVIDPSRVWNLSKMKNWYAWPALELFFAQVTLLLKALRLKNSLPLFGSHSSKNALLFFLTLCHWSKSL